jgi:hypothetical protein
MRAVRQLSATVPSSCSTEKLGPMSADCGGTLTSSIVSYPFYTNLVKLLHLYSLKTKRYTYESYFTRPRQHQSSFFELRRARLKSNVKLVIRYLHKLYALKNIVRTKTLRSCRSAALTKAPIPMTRLRSLSFAGLRRLQRLFYSQPISLKNLFRSIIAKTCLIAG